MLSFGEYFQEKSDSFSVEGVLISLEAVPLDLFERHILGVDNTDPAGLVKYRVTFKYPRSERKAGFNNYEDEVQYILAAGPGEAKKRVEEYVRNKKMKSYGGVKSNIPVDYLSKLKRDDLDIKVREVKSWKDFVDLCSFVAKKKPQNPLRYFDQADLAIFIKKYRKSTDYSADLQSLPKDVQLLMKRVYKHVTQGDLSPENHAELSRSGKYTSDSVKDVLHRKSRGLGKFVPKPALKDIHEEPPSMGSAAEVISMAKSYGIPYKELKAAKDGLAYEYDPMFAEKLAAYRDIRQRLFRANASVKRRENPLYRGTGAVRDTHPMFGGDEKGWDKFGADTWVDEISSDHPWLNSQEKIFDFYRGGMPRMAPPLDLWSRALETVLQHRREGQRHDPEEIIPF